MKTSSFDRVKSHLLRQGADTPAPAVMQDDLDAVVRRCDEVRSLGQAYGSVELSPYMKSLLRVSDAAAHAARHAVEAPRVAAAGV